MLSRAEVIIRVDASLQMGSGHVHRCLALAEGLRQSDLEVIFLSREQPGDLINLVHKRGFKILTLPSYSRKISPARDANYAGWLGCSYQQDSDECHDALGGKCADLLIIDHYSLDARWMREMRGCAERILVIDDLANRAFDCDYLINQNPGFKPDDYQSLVPADCQLLLGTEYAMLRSEFAAMRDTARSRRGNFQGVNRILLAMGGADRLHCTNDVVRTLECVRPEELAIIFGSQSGSQILPDQVKSAVFRMQVLTDVETMAEWMVWADFAIGAAGTTSWERCCMGLPSAVFVTAANQRPIADALAAANAGWILPNSNFPDTLFDILDSLNSFPQRYMEYSENAASLCDGQGVSRICRLLTG